MIHSTDILSWLPHDVDMQTMHYMYDMRWQVENPRYDQIQL